jgi:hypothetical protein
LVEIGYFLLGLINGYFLFDKSTHLAYRLNEFWGLISWQTLLHRKAAGAMGIRRNDRLLRI